MLPLLKIQWLQEQLYRRRIVIFWSLVNRGREMYMTSSTAITSERGHKCGSRLLSAMASPTSPVQLLWEVHRINKDVNLQEHKQKLRQQSRKILPKFFF